MQFKCIKKLKKDLQEWCLNSKGWELEGSKKKYDISKIEDKEQRRFYKDMKKIYSLNKHNKEEEKIINDWKKILKQ